jgi:hypothetical protein
MWYCSALDAAWLNAAEVMQAQNHLNSVDMHAPQTILQCSKVDVTLHFWQVMLAF